MSEDSPTISLAQITSKLGDVESNLSKILGFIKKAKSDGASIVIFPELSLTGYYVRDLVYELAETVPGKSFDRIKEEAVKNSIHVVFGMPERASKYSDIIFNSAVWIKPNGDYSVYRKIHLPTYRMFEEQKYFRPGTRPVYVDTEYGRFGLTICFDAFFPELTRYLVIKDCHTVINISASPNPSKTYFETILRARALENTINIIYVNTVGVQESVNFWGGSFAFSSRGETYAQCKYYEEDYQIFKLNLSEILAMKKNRPVLKHVNKEIFKFCYDALNEL
ncbi:MAG TPA: carbon-nitrogen hydrolase family protein [Geobacterales bacterium]|nr:carbon-nitrogen hydrolase family protein [Geobacterales bacterium]